MILLITVKYYRILLPHSTKMIVYSNKPKEFIIKIRGGSRQWKSRHLVSNTCGRMCAPSRYTAMTSLISSAEHWFQDLLYRYPHAQDRCPAHFSLPQWTRCSMRPIKSSVPLTGNRIPKQGTSLPHLQGNARQSISDLIQPQSASRSDEKTNSIVLLRSHDPEARGLAIVAKLGKRHLDMAERR